MLRNAGIDRIDGERLIRALDAGAITRADVLRSMIEDASLYRREYNTAFVLVHFFGYLGRNPDDPPDKDLSGFYFWTEMLDRTRDYRSLSRALMESGEYKNRRVQ